MLRFLPTLFALLAAAPPAAAQPRLQGPEAALAQDGAEYARRYGVSPQEGLRRLRAQHESVAATDQIRREFAGRLGGISIEHHPELRIVVLLTGDAPVANRNLFVGGMSVPILFRTGARATAAQVLAAIGRHREAIRDQLPGAEGLGQDPRTGSLVVVADRVDLDGREQALVEARLTALTGVPVRLRLLDSDEGNLGVEGGARVEGQNPGDARRSFCTTGFTVTDGARTGIVTAAHCPDRLTYYAPGGRQIPLEFVGQWGAQFQDVQVNLGTGGELPSFYADRDRNESRPLTAARLRSSTRAGETVCHLGEASGYSCAEVEYTDYAPPGDLCGGPCHPVWVAVSGPSCRAGDSGGPVFVGTRAFGIVKGANYAADGRCNFYYYMSTDYLPPRWSLLLDGSAAGIQDRGDASD
jgi:hypothetical protein